MRYHATEAVCNFDKSIFAQPQAIIIIIPWQSSCSRHSSEMGAINELVADNMPCSYTEEQVTCMYTDCVRNHPGFTLNHVFLHTHPNQTLTKNLIFYNYLDFLCYLLASKYISNIYIYKINYMFVWMEQFSEGNSLNQQLLTNSTQLTPKE